MKQFVTLICATSVVASALAGDPMVIARERAKETSQAVSSGQPVPSRAAQPAAQPAPAPPNPALMAMQVNISNLAADLATLQADPSKKQPLINDLNAAALGASPSKASLGRLAGDFTTALTGKSLSAEQRTKLAQYLRAVSNSSHLSPAQQRTVLDDAQKILQAGGVSADDSAKVIADFKAIAAETK